MRTPRPVGPGATKKKKDKYEAGAEEAEERTISTIKLWLLCLRWRDAGEEVKSHNVSHVDAGNFIKLRSSGV